MGTTVSVTVETELSQASQVSAEVESLTQQWGREWYAWTSNGGSELARLNAAFARGEAADVSPELRSLLIRSRELFAASEGYFDPAVGRAVALWGFTGAERSADLRAPTDNDLANWAANHPTFAELEIGDHAVGSSSTALQLDLGAIAKGRIVDLAVAHLKQQGIRNAMVDAGGNLRVIGTSIGKPWRIAVRDPRGAEPLAWLNLGADESVSTSGDYEHQAMVDGRRVHHLLDPHDGRPVSHTQAVTVLAADATTADAASTAVMAAGPARWRRVAKRLGLRYVLRIDGEGNIEVSSALRPRLNFSASVPHQRRIETVEL